jgi:hypothetical protein
VGSLFGRNRVLAVGSYRLFCLRWVRSAFHVSAVGSYRVIIVSLIALADSAWLSSVVIASLIELADSAWLLSVIGLVFR